MSRRTLLGGAVIALTGCGFELRKAPSFAFKTLVLPGKTAFINAVRRNLRAAGTVELLEDDQTARAEAIMDILSEARDTIVLSTNSSGQVRELQLRFTVRFRLRGQNGKELLGFTEIQQTRDITYNETSALAKESESELLYRDMQTDIAQQVIRRLAAVKSL